MADEFYDAVSLEASRDLYQKIRAWAQRIGGVTLMGGWAVYELVTPGHQRQSRDVDIIVHSEAALESFNAELRGWGLQWRTHGRDTFKECLFTQGPAYPPVVDVFTTDPSIGQARFHVNTGTNVKEAPGQGLVPTLEFLLLDKLGTLPLRSGTKAANKQAKDLLDIYDLVFYNRDGKIPRELATTANQEARKTAAKFMPDARRARPEFGREHTDVLKWLRL